MSQKVVLAKMYMNDQDKVQLRIDKRNWVKQHNFSTRTLYDGFKELAKVMDVSKYVDLKNGSKNSVFNNENLYERNKDFNKDNFAATGHPTIIESVIYSIDSNRIENKKINLLLPKQARV